VPVIPMSSGEIAEDIASRIASGEYKPGDKLPSYRELAELYGVHFATAARAVRDLRIRGLVIGAVGRGTFVA
jgi:GntR family transcriptional regulator